MFVAEQFTGRAGKFVKIEEQYGAWFREILEGKHEQRALKPLLYAGIEEALKLQNGFGPRASAMLIQVDIATPDSDCRYGGHHAFGVEGQMGIMPVRAAAVDAGHTGDHRTAWGERRLYRGDGGRGAPGQSDHPGCGG